MRDSSCPKYTECTDEAAKLNITFDCKKCKKRNQNLIANRSEIPSNPIMFKVGGRSKCENECVRCQWRNSCRNAKPKCYRSKSKYKEEGGN